MFVYYLIKLKKMNAYLLLTHPRPLQGGELAVFIFLIHSTS